MDFISSKHILSSERFEQNREISIFRDAVLLFRLTLAVEREPCICCWVADEIIIRINLRTV